MQIQGLIWAAINYFFKRDRAHKLPQLAITNDLADPWLTMSNLFGQEEVTTEQSLILESPTDFN